MNNPAHVIIYSHGFGVRQDDRGLFTDIAAALPGVRHVIFDYNQFDEATSTLTVAPLSDQAEKLGRMVAEVRAKYPNATIDLICHSQGCVVAALARPAGIRKVVFTAPPSELSVDSMVELFKNRPGSEVHLDGMSHLKRADFSTTDVPPAYWKSIEQINPVELYNKLAQETELVAINATQDEILGGTDFNELSPKVKVSEIATGHNFEGAARQELIGAISKELGL